jgi:hypothetical protein
MCSENYTAKVALIASVIHNRILKDFCKVWKCFVKLGNAYITYVHVVECSNFCS